MSKQGSAACLKGSLLFRLTAVKRYIQEISARQDAASVFGKRNRLSLTQVEMNKPSLSGKSSLHRAYVRLQGR